MEEHFKYKFEELFNPLLTALHNLGGSATGDDIESEVIQILNLNDDEINEIHRETTTKLTYRQAWAKNYLKRFGLLENSSRGVWSLTEEGLKTNYVDAEEVKRKVKDVKENERIKKEQSATILENRNVQDESKEVETIISQEEESHYNINQYKFSEDKDKPFISESDFLQAVSLLRRKKNIILQGPPGVGKTFIAKKIAYQVMREINDTNIEIIQFHQSYSYEDFIQGLRPSSRGGFDLKNGIFYSFCKRAIENPERPYFFIIDEINRGNLSKVFGELMMLIEADKRGESFALKLTYSEDDKNKFFVPSNLYIIGTMNTADRSLAIVDYALRRRFAFITLQPDFGNTFQSCLKERGVTGAMVEHICSSVSKVNKRIKEDINLGNGYQIGHSYFCSFNKNENEDKWWSEILTFEIKPLLEEIWFDDVTKVDEGMKVLSKQ